MQFAVVLCSFAVYACAAEGGIGGTPAGAIDGDGKDDGKDDGKGGGKGGGAGGGVGGGAGGGAGGGVGGGAGGGGGEVIEGRMTGGGFIFCDGIRVSHGFELHCDPEDEPNNIEINWDAGPGEENFHLDALVEPTFCLDNPDESEGNPVAGFDELYATGTGTLNQEPGCTVDLTLTDYGEPGREDLFGVVITCSGNEVLNCEPTPLTGGNHQAHRLTGSDLF